MCWEARMRHHFGILLDEICSRKHGLSQTRLATLAGYDPSLISRMRRGSKDLTGPSGRDRVLRIIEVLREQGALTSVDEANALLESADLPPLYAGQTVEAALMQSLHG